MVFEKHETHYLQDHKEIYAITILQLGFKSVITKVQYQDGMVGERKFTNTELTDLLIRY